MDAPAFQPIEANEVLTMPKNRKARASIRLARLAEGWAYAASAQRNYGDYTGFGDPLGLYAGRARNPATTREEALSRAIARVRRGLTEPVVNDWLDTLMPMPGDQGDLFSNPPGGAL